LTDNQRDMISKKPFRVIIGFLGNLFYDTRTYNLFALLQKDHHVRFIGFDWLTPGFQTRKSSKIMITKLKKRKWSLLFYIEFNIRLLAEISWQRADIIWAADFFSLPACFVAAKWMNARIYYDSREVYTGIYGISSRPLLKKLVYCLEKCLIQRTDRVFVTGLMDMEVIQSLYGIRRVYLLRNLPRRRNRLTPMSFDFIRKSGLKRILCYQGTLVHGRGISTCFRIVERLPMCGLVLLGGGEHVDVYKKMAESMQITDRVWFPGKIPQDQLLRYTAAADFGLSLIDDVSLNNQLALPNKLFEYIMAGIPVLVSDCPQMVHIIQQYQVGAVIKGNDPEIAVNVIKHWIENPRVYQELKNNCLKASKTLNWEVEFKTIERFFTQ
jgi:glycosyltransferase involved in cell wall biosynthesis